MKISVKKIVALCLGAGALCAFFIFTVNESKDGDLLRAGAGDSAEQVRARLDSQALNQVGGIDESVSAVDLHQDLRTLIEQGGKCSGNDECGLWPGVFSQEISQKAFRVVRQAAQTNDQAVLAEISQMNQDCEWCDSFYDQTRRALSGADLTPKERAYLASVLARSGRTDNVRQLVQLMEEAANHPEAGVNPGTYSNPLEDVPVGPEIVDQIAADLASNNPFLREAAVSILTKQGTVSAAEQLYNHTVERGDPDGYYRAGIGIGEMKPKAEALEYIEQLVNKRDQYSHLAVKALLNYGKEGLDRVVAIFGQSSSYEMDKLMLRGAIDHISSAPEMLTYVEGLSQSAGSKAIRELAKDVLREHEMDLKNQHQEIEYNKNFEKGLVF